MEEKKGEDKEVHGGAGGVEGAGGGRKRERTWSRKGRRMRWWSENREVRGRGGRRGGGRSSG